MLLDCVVSNCVLLGDVGENEGYNIPVIMSKVILEQIIILFWVT